MFCFYSTERLKAPIIEASWSCEYFRSWVLVGSRAGSIRWKKVIMMRANCSTSASFAVISCCCHGKDPNAAPPEALSPWALSVSGGMMRARFAGCSSRLIVAGVRGAAHAKNADALRWGAQASFCSLFMCVCKAVSLQKDAPQPHVKSRVPFDIATPNDHSLEILMVWMRRGSIDPRTFVGENTMLFHYCSSVGK